MEINTKSVKIAVCIATYKRPLGLQRLLRSLRDLKFIKSQTPDWFVIVVENDSSMPNKALVNIIKRGFPVPVIYGVESTRGIASTRNRAVQLAGNVDFIAFIDDDEIADSDWLDELLFVQHAFSADVITGPVVPRFEQSPPSWALKGRFFERPRYSTGTVIKYSRTGNVLLKAYWLTVGKGPFDKRMNLTGSEDSLLFRQIYDLGAKIVWADEAVVTEFIPPTRMSAHWLLLREFRGGINYSRVEIMVGSSFFLLMVRALKGAIHIMRGLLLVLPASICWGYTGLIKGLILISRGIGQICGLLGVRYQEYKRIHGK